MAAIKMITADPEIEHFTLIPDSQSECPNEIKVLIGYLEKSCASL